MMDTASVFDVLRIKRTELGGKAKQWVVAYLASPEQPPNSDIAAQSDESEPLQIWQHYGFASRPPANAESFTIRAGAMLASIATRVAEAVYGAMGEGDVALFTTGGNVLKMRTDGSATFLAPVEGSKQQVAVHYSPKKGGSFKLTIPNGPSVEISAENGIYLNAGVKECTIASQANIQCVGKSFTNACGVFKTHIAAAKPLVGVACLTPGAPNVMI